MIRAVVVDRYEDRLSAFPPYVLTVPIECGMVIARNREGVSEAVKMFYPDCEDVHFITDEFIMECLQEPN